MSDTPEYAGPGGVVGVTFAAPSHPWGFSPAQEIRHHTGAMAGTVLRRLYDADNGTPHYHVQWCRPHGGSAIGHTVEHASYLEEFYKAV